MNPRVLKVAMPPEWVVGFLEKEKKTPTKDAHERVGEVDDGRVAEGVVCALVVAGECEQAAHGNRQAVAVLHHGRLPGLKSRPL